MIQVVTELIFLLIAQRREERDGSRELIVAVRLKARHRERRRAERKRQREAQSRIARLCEVQFARIEHERAQPPRAERISVADDAIPVIVVRS